MDDFIKNNSGLSMKLKNLIVLRYELLGDILLKDLNKYQWDFFLNFIYKIIPKKHNLKRRLISNLFVLDLINSYKGWRHFKGLPVRGQRT
jgi:ribosomal protein S13